MVSSFMDDAKTPPTPQGQLNDLDQYKKEASSAEMGEAYLGGVRGRGTLHVVRDQNGAVFEVAGTWRLADDAPDEDVSSIHDAHEQGTPILYKGQLSDTGKPDKETIETEVEISSIQTYTFGADEDSAGTERTLYNYDIVGKLPYSGDISQEDPKPKLP